MADDHRDATIVTLRAELADLHADVAELARAARAAEALFGTYAMHHAAKPDMEKAQRNWDMARALAAALAKFPEAPDAQ